MKLPIDKFKSIMYINIVINLKQEDIKMREVEKVIVRATDLLEVSRHIIDSITSEVLLIVRNGKFCLQSRTEDKDVIWTTGWKEVISGTDCTYGFSADDYLKVLELVIGGFEDIDADYVSFIFTKDRKLTRVATSDGSVWFDYAHKLN
jgi:hypothetical protein